MRSVSLEIINSFFMRTASTYFWIVMLLSLSTPALVFSQNKEKIDSIRRIADSEAVDTIVVYHCNELAKMLRDSNPEEAVTYAEKALQLSREIDYKYGQAVANYWLGMSYYSLNEYEKSIKYNKESSRLFLLQKNRLQYYRCLNKIGVSYFNLGEFEKADAYIKRSLKHSKMSKDTSNSINCYLNLGNIYFHQSEYNKAILYFDKALQLSEEAEKTYVHGIILASIGKSLNSINNKQKAKAYFFEALRIVEQYQNESFVPTCYLYLADIYISESQLDSAFVMISKAKQAVKNTNSIILRLSVLQNEANLLSLNDKNVEALRIYKEVNEISNAQNLASFHMEASLSIAELYFKMKDFNQAEEYAQKAINLAERLGSKEVHSNALKILYKVNKAKGNVADALAFHEQYAQFRDSVYNVETAELISEYEARYEAEKRKKEILELNRKNQQQEIVLLEERKTKQIQLLVFGVSFIILLSGTFITYLKVKTNKEKDIAKLKEKRFHDVIEAAEMERKRIAGDLHDSVGLMLATTKLNLNELEDSILLTIAEDEKSILEHTLKLIDETSTEVRNISHNMMPGALIELGLQAAISDLVSKINQLEHFTAAFESQGKERELTEMKRIAVFRIVQEIAGNTLKHAEADKISIKMSFQKKYLNILYVDNGKGMKDINPDSSTGIGWKNIYSRLEIVNGTIHFDKEYSQGTKIILLIPINIQ